MKTNIMYRIRIKLSNSVKLLLYYINKAPRRFTDQFIEGIKQISHFIKENNSLFTTSSLFIIILTYFLSEYSKIQKSSESNNPILIIVGAASILLIFLFICIFIKAYLEININNNLVFLSFLLVLLLFIISFFHWSIQTIGKGYRILVFMVGTTFIIPILIYIAILLKNSIFDILKALIRYLAKIWKRIIILIFILILIIFLILRLMNITLS